MLRDQHEMAQVAAFGILSEEFSSLGERISTPSHAEGRCVMLTQTIVQSHFDRIRISCFCFMIFYVLYGCIDMTRTDTHSRHASVLSARAPIAAIVIERSVSACRLIASTFAHDVCSCVQSNVYQCKAQTAHRITRLKPARYET